MTNTLDSRTGVRQPSRMYDFHCANLQEENTWGIHKLAVNIKSSCLEKLAVSQAIFIRQMCLDLNLGLWANNAQRLITLLK